MNSKDSRQHQPRNKEKANLQDYRYEYLDVETFSKLGNELYVSVEETLEQASNRYCKNKSGVYIRAPIKIINKL